MSVCHAVIVTAAGSSSRFNAGLKSGSNVKKEFLKIGDESVLARSVLPFVSVEGLVAIVVTYKEGFKEETSELLKRIKFPSEIKLYLVQGGATRQESVFNALKFLSEENLDIRLVSIQDGARPFVSKAIIENCLETALQVGGAVPALPMSDTLVKVEKGLLCGRLDRTNVYGVQTPQTFRYPEIYQAHLAAREKTNDGLVYTDDTQIFTDYGYQVAIVPGDPKNKKITYPKDLEQL